MPRFGGIAVLQDAVDKDLAALRLLIADVGGAQEVDDGDIVGGLLLDGGEQSDDFLVFIELKVAIGEEGQGLAILGLLRDNRGEMRCGGRDVGRLIIRDREVELDGGVGRIFLERLRVFGNRFFITPGAREGGA